MSARMGQEVTAGALFRAAVHSDQQDAPAACWNRSSRAGVLTLWGRADTRPSADRNPALRAARCRMRCSRLNSSARGRSHSNGNCKAEGELFRRASCRLAGRLLLFGLLKSRASNTQAIAARPFAGSS